MLTTLEDSVCPHKYEEDPMRKKAIHTFRVIFLFAALFLSSATAYAVVPVDFDIFGSGEKVGAIHIEMKPNGANFGLIGSFRVTKDEDGIPLTLNELENFLGQDHLNWFQKVVGDTNQPNDANGNPLVPPYIDPPINGYDFQWADDRPWYFDEFSKPADDPRDWSAAFLLSNNTDGSLLDYFDFPSDSKAGTTLDFATFLVSDYGNQRYSVLGGFSWSTLTEKNEGQAFTSITSLTAGTSFRGEYADEIQREFGWNLIPEPSSALLLSLSILGIALIRRNKRFAES